MPRTSTLRIGSLNIATHPHPPGRYLALLQRAVRRHVATKARGDRFAMIASCHRYADDGEPGDWYSGQINTYIDFSLDEEWLNVTEGRAATDAERQAITLPKNMKPEFRPIPYVFNVSQHRMFFDVTQFAPSTVQRVVANILNSRKVREEEEPEVDVTVVQAAETLDRIYGLKILKRLTITVNRPNSDDGADYDEDLEERMEAQNARRLVVSYEADDSESLRPDEQTRKVASAAITNGAVVGEGKNDENKPETVSTEDHPEIEIVSWDRAKQMVVDVLVYGAKRALGRIRRGPRRTPPENRR